MKLFNNMELRKFISTTIREYLNERYIILEATADEIKSKYYADIPQNIFNSIVSTDIISSDINKGKIGKYAKWLLRLYKLNSLELRKLENAEKYIVIYDKLLNSKKDIINRDINKYTSLDELYDDIEMYVNNKKIISKSDEKKKIKKQSKVIYSDNRFTVIELMSKAASCYYGRGTKLCTSSVTSYNQFDEYIKRGSLYLIFDKSKRNTMGDYFKYQIQLEYGVYKDENNDDINFDKKPEIKELIKKIIKIININPNDLIKRNSDNIKFIDNPNENLQMKAVERDPFSIKFINNPTENVQLKVIKKEPSCIKYINNPSENIKLTAISLDPSVKKLINMTDKERREDEIKHYKFLLDIGMISQREFDDFTN